MSRKWFSVEQVVGHQRKVLPAEERTVRKVCRRIGVSEQRCDRRRREHGGRKVDQARRFTDLKHENARVERAPAGLTPDKQIVTGEARPRARRARASAPNAEGNW